MNEKEGLTREEKEHIYSRASIPAVLFFSVCVIYIAFFSDIFLTYSVLDMMNYIWVMLLFPMVCILWLSIEILEAWKTERSFLTGRFLSRVAFTGAFFSLYSLIINISHFFLSPFIPSVYTFVVAAYVASGISYVIMKIQRFKETFDKLTGEW